MKRGELLWSTFFGGEVGYDTLDKPGNPEDVS